MKQPIDSAQCRRYRLSEGGLATVDLCDCGMVTLNVGAVTLRLSQTALLDLCNCLQRAVETLHEQDGPAGVHPRHEGSRLPTH